MTENEIKEATFEDALYCAKALVGLEACEECRFYKLCHVWCDDVYGIMYKALEEVQAYREIGTIEEFKALKEKNVAKKVEYDNEDGWESYICPICGIKIIASSTYKHYCMID